MRINEVQAQISWVSSGQLDSVYKPEDMALASQLCDSLWIVH